MSNSNRVDINNLNSKITEYLQTYKEDIDEEVKEVSDKLIKEARKELKSISPKSDRTVKLKGGNSVAPRKLCKIVEYEKWKKGKRYIL